MHFLSGEITDEWERHLLLEDCELFVMDGRPRKIRREHVAGDLADVASEYLTQVEGELHFDQFRKCLRSINEYYCSTSYAEYYISSMSGTCKSKKYTFQTKYLFMS